MKSAPPLRTRFWIGITFLVFTLIGLLLSLQSYIRYGDEYPLLSLVYEEMAGWYLWLAVIPFAVFLAIRYPFNRKTLPIYIGAALGVALAHSCAHHLLYWLPRSATEKLDFNVDKIFFFYLTWRVMIFAALCVVAQIYIAYRMLSEQLVHEQELNTAIEQVAINRLRVQFDPAYVFAEFDQIQSLMKQKLLAAEIRIAELGDYLHERLYPVGLESEIAPDDQTNLVYRTQVETGKRWLLFVSIYSIIAIYFLSRQMVAHRMGPDLPTILGWLLWIPLTPRILEYAQRYPIQREWKNLIRHTTANLLIVLGLGMFVWALAAMLYSPFPGVESFLLSRTIRVSFAFDVLTYWTIVTTGTALHYFTQVHEKKLSNAERRLQLARAHLQTLKMQLQPHFLFNTLNSLSQLMYENIEAAQEMLRRLKLFLQMTLVQSDQEEVPFSSELDFLNQYLNIQKTRFEGRLTVDVEIDKQTLDCYVPNLLLQPLIENAIRHGIEKRKAGGVIRIIALKRDNRLHLRIQDNGPGMHRPDRGTGLGFEITRKRLHQLYGNSCNLSMENVPDGGFAVTMALPAFCKKEGLTA